MATWHQERNPVQLWHETDYTVVEDPPNDTRTISRFSTHALAQVYLSNLKKHGNGKHAYILPPPRVETDRTKKHPRQDKHKRQSNPEVE